MKTKPITVRLTQSEFDRLQQNARQENTTVSQFIRERISGIDPRGSTELQEIASKVCEIYIELTKLELNQNDDIMEKVDKICQILY